MQHLLDRDAAQVLFDTTASMVLDSAYRISSVSEEMLRLVGLSENELVGRHVEAAFAHLRETGPQIQSGQYPVFRSQRGGRTSWFKLRFVNYGRKTLAVACDITEEWRTLLAAATGALMRGQILKDADIETWRYDPDKQVYHYWDDFLRNGARSRMLMLEDLLPLQHPEDAPVSAEIRNTLTHSGGTATSEQRYLEPDGGWKVFRIHYRAGRKLASGLYEIYGVNQNITPQFMAKKLAGDATERLKLALNAANAGVFEIDFAKRRQWGSPEFIQLVGPETFKRVGDDHFLALYHDEDKEHVRSSWLDDPKLREICSFEARLFRAGGSDFWIKVHVRTTRDADNQPTHAVGLILDINEQKRFERLLQRRCRARRRRGHPVGNTDKRRKVR